jgi:hypothetical protein
MKQQQRIALAVFLGSAMALALLVHVTTDAPRNALLQKLEELSPDEGEVQDAPEVAAPSGADPELVYSAYQPVYARCKKVVNMPDFSSVIAKTCGNIHEYSDVAYPCVSAMQQASEHMGCCWETVMDGYQTLYPEAAHAWRMWQGTLSGKTGVTFADESCGESTGEQPYKELKKEVGSLEETIQQQQQDIYWLESQMYQPYDPYSNYGYGGGAGYDSYDPYTYDYTYYKGKKGIPQVKGLRLRESRWAFTGCRF